MVGMVLEHEQKHVAPESFRTGSDQRAIATPCVCFRRGEWGPPASSQAAAEEFGELGHRP